MTSISAPAASEFAAHVITGLSVKRGKRLSPRYFYDDLGSALFEAITLLPEYGLSRADDRLLFENAGNLSAVAGTLSTVVELGSGSGKKSRHILRQAAALNPNLTYQPIDVSQAALDACRKETEDVCSVKPVCSDWSHGLSQVSKGRSSEYPMLLLFLGSSIGNLERGSLPGFLQDLRANLREGDFMLLGADLVKNVETMIEAYDDPTGVTAAFNLNLLGRMNRELETNFDQKSFVHEARWNGGERRIEMHLVSCREQYVHSKLLDAGFTFEEGESIWTESSHKFELEELERLAASGGFTPVTAWVDEEWPFAEALWKAA